MNELLPDWLSLVLAGMAGGLLGVVFFGGLWWTVRRGVDSKRAALWFLGSWLLRTAIVLAGFYLVSDGHWEPLLAALFGFVLARFILIRLTRPSAKTHTVSTKESGHAP